MNRIGKYGLTGSSGRIGGIRLAMPYGANKGIVFVEDEHAEWGAWCRMTLRRAQREKRTIIPCSRCDKPAVSLDHYWPYYNDFTRCEDHYDEK